MAALRAKIPEVWIQGLQDPSECSAPILGRRRRRYAQQLDEAVGHQSPGPQHLGRILDPSPGALAAGIALNAASSAFVPATPGSPERNEHDG